MARQKKKKYGKANDFLLGKKKTFGKADGFLNENHFYIINWLSKEHNVAKLMILKMTFGKAKKKIFGKADDFWQGKKKNLAKQMAFWMKMTFSK